jgi:hypothetical protein
MLLSIGVGYPAVAGAGVSMLVLKDGTYPAPVVAPVKPVKALKAAKKPVRHDVRTVAEFGGPSLRAVALPLTSMEEIGSAAVLYDPGQVLPFTLPEGWVREGGKVVPVAQARRREGLVRALSSVDMALEAAGQVAPVAEVPVVAAPVDVTAAVSETQTGSMAAPVAAGAGLPLWPDVSDTRAYRPEAEKLLHQVVAAAANDKPAARERLTVFDLAWGRAVEARAVLVLNPAVTARGTLLNALAMIERGHGAEALPLLDKLDKAQPAWRPHLALWRATALAQAGRNGEALQAWPTQTGLLPQYPPRLRELAQLAHAAALAEAGSLADARAFADGLAAGYVSGTAPPRLVMVQGLSRLNTRDERDGLDLLAAVAGQRDDPQSAWEAKLAFVQTLERRGELARPQYIRYLEELARFWRGGKVEVTALRELGKQYVLARDYRAALTAWQRLVRIAPDLPDMADLTDQMTAALLAAFDPESPASYDPLQYLGMYYDFKELIPADDRGDRILERVTELLLQLGLPERAKPVAEQLVKFRLKDPVAQGRVALLLAQAQRDTGDGAGALMTLDQWRKVMTTTVLKDEWQVAEAHTLADLGKLDSAQKTLSGRRDPAVAPVQADLAWQRQDWPTLAATLKPVVKGMSPAEVSGTLPLSVLKLAYAEAENRNRAALLQLEGKWGGRSGASGQAVLGALGGTVGVTPSAELAAQPLGQVAGTLAVMEQLTAEISSTRAQAAEIHEEQRQYDDKMRYMELLPPPAL